MGSEDSLFGIIRDVIIALVIVIIIICSLYAYTRNWPPMVVIESNSMMHGKDSEVGVIDQGDLVLVKAINGRSDVITYSEGIRKNYKKHGDYGDVIVYYKNGLTHDTPVIHRAIVWVETNKTNAGTFDVPEWGIYNKETISYDINAIHLHIKNYRPQGSGFLTKGDNKATNPTIDQVSHKDINGDPVKPVRPDWVIGRGRGELPWFGLIKLKLTGNENIKDAPGNSWVNLGISIALIVGIPLTLDTIYVMWLEKKEETEEEDKKGMKSEKKGKKKLIILSKNQESTKTNKKK